MCKLCVGEVTKGMEDNCLGKMDIPVRGVGGVSQEADRNETNQKFLEGVLAFCHCNSQHLK